MQSGRKKFGADLSIIIPAAGISKKMRPYGVKSLICIGKEYLLDRQIRILKDQYPKSEIIIVIGFQSEKVLKELEKYKNDNIKIIENELYEDTTIVRSIYLATRISSNKNILIINGDLVFNEETLHNLTSNSSKAVIDSEDRINPEEIGINIINNKISYFSYGLKTKWAQIVFLNGKELDTFQNVIHKNNKKKIYTYEILNKVIEENGIIKPIEPKGMKIIEIDSIKDVNKARKLSI